MLLFADGALVVCTITVHVIVRHRGVQAAPHEPLGQALDTLLTGLEDIQRELEGRSSQLEATTSLLEQRRQLLALTTEQVDAVKGVLGELTATGSRLGNRLGVAGIVVTLILYALTLVIHP